MEAPTIIEEDQSRLPARAQWWRIHVVGMTAAELSAAISYGVEAIYRFERGHNSKGQLFGTRAWKRYLAACERIAKEKGKPGPCES
jgi:hypothetical protein